jgi:hypothetical protein
VILVVTGALTLLAAVGVVAPRWFFQLFLGAKADDVATRVLARHWSLLIALVGGLLVYAGYHPEVQTPVMVVAAIEKIAVFTLVVASPLRKRMLSMAIVSADLIMAIIYVVLLSGGR